MPEQRRPARRRVADRSSIGADDDSRRVVAEEPWKKGRVDGGDRDQPGERAVVTGLSTVTMVRSGCVVRRMRGGGDGRVDVDVRLRGVRVVVAVAMSVAMTMEMGMGQFVADVRQRRSSGCGRAVAAERRGRDAVDVADLGHRPTLQPGSDGGEHRHCALQRQRGRKGPQRQARGETGAIRHGAIVGEGEAVVR